MCSPCSLLDRCPILGCCRLHRVRRIKKFEAIRFGYYRLKNGKLKWASQITLTEPIEVYKKLFVKAAKEKEWFKKIPKRSPRRSQKHKIEKLP